jgi:hypothetical protein
MHRVGFKPTIPVLERMETVYALGLAATVIGLHTHSAEIKFLREVNLFFCKLIHFG